MALTFKYRSLERPKPLGPKTMPVIPIRLLGKNGERFDTPALLDSGADYSVIFTEHAEILGIDLAKLEETECQGVGGKARSWLTKITIELEGKGEHRAFKFDVPFMVLKKPSENHPILIGRAVFFEKFEITFKEKHERIILKPETIE